MSAASIAATTATDTAARIRSRLVASVAVHPSPDWIRACLEHLQRNRNTNRATTATATSTVTADEVFFQVLYADLRDVVRPSSTLPVTEEFEFDTAAALVVRSSNSNNNKCLPSTNLKEGIGGSFEADRNCHHMLPESFALLCQLEDVTDVAKSAEQRLQLGGSNNTTNGNANPNQYGPRGSSSRCSKVWLSDGHEEGTAAMAIVGIETTPIPGLSPGSLAGSKILLKGPLEIKHGILLLHPGNCVVLGGCCADLVRHQHQSREAAQKKAGVGVDPTVRALIGNYDDDEDLLASANHDEAHEASGDVVARPPPQQQQQQNRSIAVPETNNNNGRLSPPAAGRKRNASEMSNHGNNDQSRDSGSNSNQRPHQWTSTSTSTSAVARNPYTGGGRTHTTNISTSTSTSNSTSTSTSTTENGNGNGNPYQQQPTSTLTAAIGAATRNPYTGGDRTHTSTSTSATSTSTTGDGNGNGNGNWNPYQRATSVSHPQQSQLKPPPQKRKRSSAPGSAEPYTTATTAVVAAAATITPIANNHHILNNNSNNNIQQPLTATARPSNDANAGAVLVQNMSFVNLRRLLLELVGNRDMYESYCQRSITFKVELSVSDPNLFRFDVVKMSSSSSSSSSSNNNRKSRSPVSKQKTKKKYEYFTSARFGSGQSSNGSDRGGGDGDAPSMDLACKIHAGLLEPCFELSPNDCRKLSRTDRPRCTSITNAGGEAVRQTYFALRVWRASLYLDADQVFGGDTNANANANASTPIASSPHDRLRDLQKPILLLRTEPLL